ncbi:MAG: carboxymuconolactone decarboxylase family protein [Wenzhouxiangellaceae bacterium]
MSDQFAQFRARREHGNQRVLDTKSLAIKRFFGLDKTVYGEGALSTRSKELMGLVASMVLRCNDCIDYHLQRCVEEGWSRDEIDEAMSVALMVGGSIVIPHCRHAAVSLDFLFAEADGQATEEN